MTDDMNERASTLPELSDARIDEIETALFAQIRRERSAERSAHERRRRVRRGRVWLSAGAAAAVVVVAAAIAPAMPGLLGGASSGSDAAPAIAEQDRNVEGADGGVDLDGPATGDAMSASGIDREIVATASATVRVADPEDAAEQIADTAESLGGYVEAVSIGGGLPMPIDSGMQPLHDTLQPAPESMPGQSRTVSPDTAWLTVRVPASRLDDATAELRQVGEVIASQTDRRDVTGEAVDLRARIDALRASVERLTALVGEADSTSDLIAAEEALAARQAELESYEQQLKMLDELVGMSTLTVSLVAPDQVVAADPAGFGDGLAAGWNGLVATLNGIVIALGFLLPWLAVAAVVLLIVWAVLRTRRRRSRAATPGASEAWEDADADDA